jgi:hypothetical protein
MTSELLWENNSQENFQIMFHICVDKQKVQGKELMLCSYNFFKMQWLGTLKYTIFWYYWNPKI